MTQEEKARAYDQAIINGSRLWECGLITRESYEYIFHELKEKESEDDMIRQSLIKSFTNQHDSNFPNVDGFTRAQILSWLEKQGEQKPADKVESELKIEKDKWYVCIRDLDDNYGTRAFSKGRTYHSTKNETLIPDNSNIPSEIKYYVNEYFRPWTIQDAKDGDVLVNKHGCPLIFKDRETCWCYYSIPCEVFRPKNNRWFFSSEDCLYPAVKEQRDLLFQKMKEAGYEWDSENKILKKIEQKPEEWSKRQVVNAITSMLSERLNPLIKKSSDGTISHREEMFMDALVEMRSFVNSPSFQIGKDVSDEWSEEDEMAMDAIAQLMKDCERNNGWERTYIDDGNVEVKFDYITSWLKSLKPQPKQEWSEEDERHLNTTIAYLQDAKEFKKNAENCINWLKSSLRPQPHWNPSEEQKPVDKVYTFKAIPRLLGLIQPSARAKSYCQKLIASLEQEGYSTDAKIVRGYLKRMNGETIAMATMDEQKHTGDVSWWTEEDEDIKYSIIDILTRQGFQTQVNWLKNLKPHWKPSEEQMCNLKGAYESYDFCDGERYALESLYNDLQKLL